MYRFRTVAVLWALAFPAVSLGQNLAPNPSFESLSGALPANWALCTGSGAGLLESASDQRDQGTRSLRLTVTQTGDVGVCSNGIAVAPGVTFRLAARLNVNIAPVKDKQARLQILELSSTDTQVASRIVATSVGRAAGWESLSGFFTTGPDTAKVKIRLLQDVPGSVGTKFYWDTLSLQRDTAVAWERWERELTSIADYTVG
ncbi:MAG: carbohydrate binding domain-containing protein, partial [Thermoanaerobaculia bacterium]